MRCEIEQEKYSKLSDEEIFIVTSYGPTFATSELREVKSDFQLKTYPDIEDPSKLINLACDSFPPPFENPYRHLKRYAPHIIGERNESEENNEDFGEAVLNEQD